MFVARLCALLGSACVVFADLGGLAQAQLSLSQVFSDVLRARLPHESLSDTSMYNLKLAALRKRLLPVFLLDNVDAVLEMRNKPLWHELYDLPGLNKPTFALLTGSSRRLPAMVSTPDKFLTKEEKARTPPEYFRSLDGTRFQPVGLLPIETPDEFDSVARARKLPWTSKDAAWPMYVSGGCIRLLPPDSQRATEPLATGSSLRGLSTPQLRVLNALAIRTIQRLLTMIEVRL